jgi:hypothetical protein
MSFISGRLGRLLAGASTIVALGATLTLAPSATAGTEADGPHYQEPAVGECRNYDFATALGKTAQTPLVACSARHTAKTFDVVQIPVAMSWSTPLGDIADAAYDKCLDAFVHTVGGTDLKRRMTRYGMSLYFPTLAQRDHGARWVRCDVVVWGKSALVPLRNTTPLLPSGKPPYAVTKCLTGTKRYYTACAFVHSYRVTGGFQLTGTTYPGDAAVKRAAERRCPQFITTHYYVWEGPDRDRWRAGNHAVLCYSKTTH